MKPKISVNADSNSELTIEKLRSYTGFEDFSDQEATQAIQFIKRMAKTLFNLYKENSSNGKA